MVKLANVQSYRTTFRKLDGIAQQIVANLYQPVTVTHQNDVAASGNVLLSFPLSLLVRIVPA